MLEAKTILENALADKKTLETLGEAEREHLQSLIQETCRASDSQPITKMGNFCYKTLYVRVTFYNLNRYFTGY